MGNDGHPCIAEHLCIAISIHVPAWGTTPDIHRYIYDCIISIHVPAWGTTGISLSDNRKIVLFQSTFPRGERLFTVNLACNCHNFNPRSRVGNDSTVFVYCNSTKISIHVPAWGTTDHWQGKRNFQSHFNPRSRVGNDRAGHECNKTLNISIHVPAWGTTKTVPVRQQPLLISIHVPAWGTTSLIQMLKQRL